MRSFIPNGWASRIEMFASLLQLFTSQRLPVSVGVFEPVPGIATSGGVLVVKCETRAGGYRCHSTSLPRCQMGNGEGGGDMTSTASRREERDCRPGKPVQQLGASARHAQHFTHQLGVAGAEPCQEAVGGQSGACVKVHASYVCGSARNWDFAS